MQITGTHFNYFQVCHRKLWLFANGINMEHNSDLVYAGKLIHEESYPQRSERYEEIEIDGIKVDYYDAKRKVIHEIKKSDKVERAHEWQLKNSVFEGEITEVKLTELKAKAKKIMDVESDSLIVFSNTATKWMNKEIVGKERAETDVFL